MLAEAEKERNRLILEELKEIRDRHWKRKREAKRRRRVRKQTVVLTGLEKYYIKMYYIMRNTISYATGISLVVDHIQPIAAGGSNHPDNLQILTRELDEDKSNKWPLTKKQKSKYDGIRFLKYYPAVPQDSSIMRIRGYTGNKQSKKLHLRTCKHAESVSLVNKVAFMTRKIAIDEKYEPCSICEPYVHLEKFTGLKGRIYKDYVLGVK